MSISIILPSSGKPSGKPGDHTGEEMGRINPNRIVTTVIACLALALLVQPGDLAAAEHRQQPERPRAGMMPIEQVAHWSAPPVDVNQLLQEDEANRERRDIPYRIGFPMDTDLSPANSGSWEVLPGGDSVWRLKVHSEGAIWVVLGFGTFKLQPGGEMTVYDSQRKRVKGPYTSADIRKHGQLWFPPIAGDTLVVELLWPEALYAEQPNLHLTTVSHGYKPFGPVGRTLSDGSSKVPGSAGACNIDTTCPEADDWQNEKRGAVQVLVGGSGNCSGALINTTANDCRTYLLTASHCGESGPSTTIGFNYECPTCGCTTDPGTITAQTLTGGVLLADYATSDFTLIEMDEAPPEEWGAYFIGWSRDPAPADYTYVISYPSGDVKKIAYDADPPIDGHNYGSHHWRIADTEDLATYPDIDLSYTWGTTEPASSGSPLMDHNHRIIGQLHGGTASCSSDTWDEYGKIDASWIGGGTPASRLSDWLDPLATGAMFVDGIDHSVCLYQPAGQILFTQDLYNCDDTLTITLRDDNIPGDPATFDVTVSSATEVTPETVTLSKVDPDIGSYSGSIQVSTVPPVNGDGLLSVGHGDILTVIYIDADDGAGGIDITVKDNADADCAPPVISNVQSTDITGSAATITWDTDEPADSLMTYGETPPGSLTASDADLDVAHELRVRGLEECTTHFFSVASTDAVGNGAEDNNGGLYYTFETGWNSETDYPSTDTPLAIVDSGTINSIITIADNDTVLGIKVELNITHTYDGDLDITLISPLGTRVLLVADRGGSAENFTNTLFDDEAATPIADGTAPFTGSFQPEEPLAGATGISGLGDWTLEVVDDAGSDTGTLDSWTLTLIYPSQLCYQPAGTVSLDEDLYTCSETMAVTVYDDSLQGDPTVDVEVYSTTEPTPETVTLTADAPGSGHFTGTLPLTILPASHGDGALSVAHGDTITAEYIDADDGAGGTNILRQDFAEADCEPPVISSVQSSNITGSTATITWNTDEPSDSLVTYGLIPPGVDSTGDPGLVTVHGLMLAGLEECSMYFFSVASTDALGNSVEDNNGGSYYTFETGRNQGSDFASYDTPIAIIDSGTINSVISVPDNKTVLDIEVEINITHGYDADLDVTLINPLGTRIMLVADRGSSNDNFVNTLFDDDATTPIADGSAPFTGSFQPEEPLSGATGGSALGDWTLEVVDDSAGIAGTLDSWTLTLTYAAGVCGPSATYDYHALEADECPVGAGDGNGFWDTGEQIQFSLTVNNDGTEPLTGVTARVIPRTDGVIMIDPVADYGDIAKGASATSLAPHYTALLPMDLTCGADLAFDVMISANEGSWFKSFTQGNGEVIPGGPAVVWSEDFDSAGIPSGWTIVDGSSDGFTWYTDNSGDPAGCSNTDPNPPITGNWATVDSDCAGSGVAMDEELITSAINLTGILGVTLEFDHYFNWLGPETADVDVRSSLTSGAWVNIGRWTADTANPEHVAIDISAQADGVADLQIRWHYYDADFEWFWHVDNVMITYPTAPDCAMPDCLVLPTGPPPVPDGLAGGVPLTVDRLLADGSRLELTWDDQCAPVNTNIIFGPLDQVSGYTISGEVCGVANPAIWDPAPAGNVWFLLVSDDGAGVESSWGLVLGAERNGLGQSNTCGNSSKVLTGTCP